MLSPGWIMISSTISKAISVAITYPYQVIRSRMQMNISSSSSIIQQQQQQNNSLKNCVSQMIKQEGMKSMYRGIIPNMTRNAPPAGLLLTLHEVFKYQLGKLKKD